VLPSATVQSADWLSATLNEAWEAHTPLLVVGWIAAAAVRARIERTSRTRAPMRGTAILLVLHIVSLPVLGYLAATKGAALDTVRGVSLTLATLAGITIGLVLLLDGFFRAVRVVIPRLLADVVAAAAYVIGGLVVLHSWGVNLGGLIATSAVLTAVIGFSLQDTLGNLMGGVALQMEKSIRPGDWLQFGKDVGRVVEIRWRQTTVETRNWETLIIPNSQLAKNQFTILGRRLGQPVQLRRWVYFNVDFRHKPTDVIRVVTQALSRAPIEGVAREPEPNCVHMDMRESFNSYAARYWLTDLSRDDPTDSLVRTRVFFALERNGIHLTMPAHAVFLTEETPERKIEKARAEDVRSTAALRRMEIFTSLADEEIAELSAGLRFSPFASGETLTREGDVGHDLYLIDRGWVSIRVGHAGQEREVALIGEGDFFGERSLMTGDVRSATTVAVGDVVCWRLAKSQLETLIKRRPALAVDLAKTLARRAEELDSIRTDLSDAARKHRLDDDTRQFVTKIRSFFGL
jgi:small-conductance mechanosensitive channel/CRP-like cAMP-binding protein